MSGRARTNLSLQAEGDDDLTKEQRQAVTGLENVVTAWDGQAKFLAKHSLTCDPPRGDSVPSRGPSIA